jgi:DNA-binding response OmpR family regulator
VDEASSIADVLSRTSAAGVQLVLIEAIFPDGSGNDACRGLRASGFEAPIVIVSAYNQKERRLALDAGADDYIVKPFGLRGLLKTVDKHLQPSP